MTTKGQATRERLLQAAAAELVHTGGTVELAAVARRAEVSAGLPYRYFGSKGELVAAVVHQVFDRFEEAILRPFMTEDAETWIDREKLRLRRSVAFFTADPLYVVALRLLSGDPLAAQAQSERVSRHVRAAADNIRRGQATGEIPADLDAEIAGAFIMGGLFQALISAQAATPPWEADRLSRHLERLLERVVEV